MLVRKFEGLRTAVYGDANGFGTIGYGHRLKPGESNKPITENDAELLLADDLDTAAQGIRRLVTIELTQCEFDALCDFVYNVGAGNFSRSSILTFLNTNRITSACQAFGLYVKDEKGNVLNGLAERRSAEQFLFSGLVKT